MTDAPVTAISPLQPLTQMFGGQQGATPGLGSAGNSIGGGVNNMISALMKGYNNAQNAQALAPNAGTYEGNIQTPANPFGSVEQPSMPPATPSAAPSIPPSHPGGTVSPINPFTQGAHSTPFLNGSALFGQLPMAGSSPSTFAQRPNPISQMQL